MAQKKNKVEEVKAPPVISKLPIPISDSPLVIDLPDGQKLVVGRMIQGSVIEVATWRGTGRPDSRTSRLMLGMSVGDVNATPEQSNSEAQSTGDHSAQSQRTSQLSNPQLAKVQEFWWAITANPLFKKLFGKPEPKQARAPKSPVAVQAVEAPAAPDAIATIPAEPISPFTQTASPSAKKSKASLAQKLFGPSKSAKSGKKVKVSKGSRAATSWSGSTGTSVPTASGDEIDAWLEEISSKAKARVESKSAPVKAGARPSTSAKKSSSAGKTAKKATPVAKKRK
jgi:hypothetical protein